ncbi:MAG: sigma-70 family RNA polymerase sigma factor [Planctomycetes bacterium]|nr:sigma-70 family RNA polymerase sigma factor [Planctomycetota bacterium]
MQYLVGNPGYGIVNDRNDSQSASVAVSDGNARLNRTDTVESWVEEHANDLFRFACLRVRDSLVAEELVQETFLAALKGFDSFRGDSSPRTWLIGLLRHKIADHFRRLNRQRQVEDAATDAAIDAWFDSKGAWINKPTSQALDPSLLSQRADFWAVFKKCFHALPDRIGQAFSLRVLDDMNSDDVCKVLSLSSTNLWVMLHRARARLRACLEANWFQREEEDKN